VRRTAFALLLAAALLAAACAARQQPSDPAPAVIPCPPEGLVCIPM
jgi:hypothetical protein